MINQIAIILHDLHEGRFSNANLLLEEMKNRALYLEDPIQQDVLMFAEAVQFQEVYDPWHLVTPEVRRLSDRLIKSLGFTPPL